MIHHNPGSTHRQASSLYIQRSGFLFILLVLAAAVATAQDYEQKIRESIRKGQYSATPALVNEYYDYLNGYTATSSPKVYKKRYLWSDMCKILAYCQTGQIARLDKVKSYILQAYSHLLDDDLKGTVASFGQNCRSVFTPGTINRLAATSVTTANANMGGILRGKAGLFLFRDCMREKAYDLKTLSPVTGAELQKRVRPLTDGDAMAKQFYTNLFKEKGLATTGIFVKNGIVLINTFENRYPLNEMIAKVETYRTFFQRRFDLDSPRHYIQIYLTKNKQEMDEVSKRLHGLITPCNSLGYSIGGDNSIVVMNNNAISISGTAFHELFHILSKDTYTFLPPWLDEGVASIFEASLIEPDGEIVGTDNPLRTYFLFEKLDHPSTIDLDAFFAQSWDEFRDPKEVGFNYAFSRYAMMYLQSKGVLSSFFIAVAAVNLETALSGEEKTYKSIFLQTLNTTESGFNQDFRRWCKQFKRLSNHELDKKITSPGN